MAFTEQLDQRTRDSKLWYDASTGFHRCDLRRDQHYWDGTAWQDTDPTLVASTLSGYALTASALQHVPHLGNDGSRRWYPRRDVTTEYVEFGAPQAWNGTAWVGLNLSAPTQPQPNTLFWDRANFSLTVRVTGTGIKVEVVLKNSNAARRVRWPVAPVGLTWNADWTLTSGSDGTTVGQVCSMWGTDANETKVPLNTSYASGFVQFTANLSGLTFPITIDPTVTFRVAVGGDDWVWDSAGGFDNTTHVNAGNPFSITGGNLNGFRWVVTGPASADTVSAAKITLTCRVGRTDDVLLLYDGCAADSPAAPTSNTQASALARTTANVTQSWTTDTTTNTTYDTPDLTAVVQEIINRAGWASGNALILFIRDNGSTGGLYQQFYSYDDLSASDAQLSITYSSGGAAFDPSTVPWQAQDVPPQQLAVVGF